jgi:hypothetical protein
MATPKKAPTSGRAKTPPKQTGKPAGGKLPNMGTKKGGGAPSPIEGSQDKGRK